MSDNLIVLPGVATLGARTDRSGTTAEHSHQSVAHVVVDPSAGCRSLPGLA